MNTKNLQHTEIEKTQSFTQIDITNRRPHKHWLSLLDALRGAAALYVVCNHAAALLVIHYADASAQHSLPLKALAAVMYFFMFGHQAVVLFFVLSGFCIHFRQAEALAAIPARVIWTQFNSRKYVFRRLRRIMPPYYFALIFTVVIDWLTRKLNPGFLVHLTGNRLADQILMQHNSMSALIGSLFFVQALLSPTFGNNTPLWSLAYEFYLYALYPAFLKMRCLYGTHKTLLVVVGISGTTACYIIFRPYGYIFLLPVASYWLTWVLGAFAAEVYAGAKRLPTFYNSIGLLSVLGVGWLATARVLPVVISDTLGAVVCTLFLLKILDHSHTDLTGTVNNPVLRALTKIGSFSYSLYLTHVPLLGLICTAWFTIFHSFPTTPLPFIAGVCSAVGTAWIIYIFFERPFTSRS